jgi:hypothetical protein
MPILKYFAIAGTLLLGALFAAAAYLPATVPAIPSSNFTGLPPAWKTEVNGPLVPPTAPEPDMSSAAVAAATPAPEAAPAKPKRKHVARRRREDGDDARGYGSSAWNNDRRWASRSSWPTWR